MVTLLEGNCSYNDKPASFKGQTKFIPGPIYTVHGLLSPNTLKLLAEERSGATGVGGAGVYGEIRVHEPAGIEGGPLCHDLSTVLVTGIFMWLKTKFMYILRVSCSLFLIVSKLQNGAFVRLRFAGAGLPAAPVFINIRGSVRTSGDLLGVHRYNAGLLPQWSGWLKCNLQEV